MANELKYLTTSDKIKVAAVVGVAVLICLVIGWWFG
jgi:hypothetical protein